MLTNSSSPTPISPSSALVPCAWCGDLIGPCPWCGAQAHVDEVRGFGCVHCRPEMRNYESDKQTGTG
jgi:hypothetical protein